MTVTTGQWGLDETDVILSDVPSFDDKSSAVVLYPIGRGPVVLDPAITKSATAFTVTATGDDVETTAALVTLGAHTLTDPAGTTYDIFITNVSQKTRDALTSWACAVTIL